VGGLLGRERVTAVLAVLTVVATVAASVAVWVRATLLDTDRFMAVVEPVLDDPAFTAALSETAAAQVLAALELDARVAVTLEQLDRLLVGAALGTEDLGPGAADRLPRLEGPRLAALTPGIAAALEARVTDLVGTTVASVVDTAWLPELVRHAHAGGVAVVRSEVVQLPNVEVRDGEVRIDLVPLLARALQDTVTELRDLLPEITLPPVVDGGPGADLEATELAAALRTRLPPDFGQVVVLRPGALPEAQAAIRTLDRVVGGLVLLTVALLVLTIGTARRRRRAVVQVGAGVALAFGVATLLVRRLETLLLDVITQPDSPGVAAAVLGPLADSLRSTALLVLVAAVGLATLAHLLGRPPRPTVTGGPPGGASSGDPTPDRERRPTAAAATARIGRHDP
jgi:hypothetical protein